MLRVLKFEIAAHFSLDEICFLLDGHMFNNAKHIDTRDIIMIAL